VEHGRLDYLCFETMAEATVSAAQIRSRREPDYPGYDYYLDDRFEAVLPACIEHGTKIVSNQGWINPEGAAQRAVEHLRRLGIKGVKVAAVSGSVITDRLVDLADTVLEDGSPTAALVDSIVSAEAYVGAEPIVEALAAGATIVLTGRVADPSLFLAPMIHEFGWDVADYDRLGKGSGIGHLLECGAQVTGGYFADPGFKDVPDLWDLALPIAEVDPSGDAIITKLEDTGGMVDLRTVKEQLFYEVHDPGNYITPDCIVDFTTAKLTQDGPDRVRVSGISGKPRTPSLKVTITCAEGFQGEDTFYYAGPGARRRAELAREILTRRLAENGLEANAVQIDLIGVDAVHGPVSPVNDDPYEVGVRIAAWTKTRAEAVKIGREVDGMAVSGIGMTGKRVPHQERTREVIGVWSALVPREAVHPTITYYES
jgi:hypothetical protein